VRAICIFCGSNVGARPSYLEAAKQLGALLAQRGIGIVYGGARVGLMGQVADSALQNGGQVVGVIPRFLFNKELAHTQLGELCVVGSMHERKALMAERADAFIALPGGFGTFEEILEMITWTQLGVHKKPCGLLNVEDFYEPLRQQLDRAVSDGFLRPEHRDIALVDADPEALLRRLSEWQAPSLPKWLNRSET
jgi:uncharacterized protein (TIGR00730 family)